MPDQVATATLIQQQCAAVAKVAKTFGSRERDGEFIPDAIPKLRSAAVRPTIVARLSKPLAGIAFDRG
ncbi:hypothetical protein SH528x_004763 [Novipirellula sp. SH528]|uniref:hypothetical protein n=1 Tax=Novipirellula sp. SH528 TaxID=3454466 RepID=UPI003F9FCBA4